MSSLRPHIDRRQFLEEWHVSVHPCLHILSQNTVEVKRNTGVMHGCDMERGSLLIVPWLLNVSSRVC